jgi:hypothetical protein
MSKAQKYEEGDDDRLFFYGSIFSLSISLLDKINNTIDMPPASPAINRSTKMAAENGNKGI